MGYAYYEIPRPDGKPMKRGYSVECKCHQYGCNKRIDRGMAFLCYSCTWYFCGAHLYFSDVEADCFAGRSSQVCGKCKHELETTDLRDRVKEALAAALDNGYKFEKWDVIDICEDLATYDSELEGYEPEQLAPYVKSALAVR